MPFQYGVEVIGLIGALLSADKTKLNDVAHDFFEWLAVFLIHRQHEEREHRKHHHESRRTHAGLLFEQKEKRYADKRPAAEAD